MRSAAIEDQLCQDPAGRLRVNERDLEAEEPETGLLVDQTDALPAQAVELRGKVAYRERDVVHPRPAAREEAADGRIRLERPQQLDA
jgi:hypothetical protein